MRPPEHGFGWTSSAHGARVVVGSGPTRMHQDCREPSCRFPGGGLRRVHTCPRTCSAMQTRISRGRGRLDKAARAKVKSTPSLLCSTNRRSAANSYVALPKIEMSKEGKDEEETTTHQKRGSCNASIPLEIHQPADGQGWGHDPLIHGAKRSRPGPMLTRACPSGPVSHRACAAAPSSTPRRAAPAPACASRACPPWRLRC